MFIFFSPLFSDKLKRWPNALYHVDVVALTGTYFWGPSPKWKVLKGIINLLCPTLQCDLAGL